MTSILLEINLQRTQELNSRGIIDGDETTNLLIDTLVSTEPMAPEVIDAFLDAVPASVQERLRSWLVRGPRTEAEWESVRTTRFGATAEGLKQAKLLVRRNIESLRPHFGLDP